MTFRPITILLLLITLALPGFASAEEFWEYTFRPGDSVWSIAKKYTNSVNNWYKIQQLNEIRQGPDRKIRPGTRIVIPVSMLKAQPTPAIVIAVSGDVSVLRADGKEEKAVEGTKLYSGDRVVTGKGQNLRMQFADKSELQVLNNSDVILDKLSHHKETGMVDTRIRLNSGSVNTWVEKQRSDSRYEVKTPAAVTAVRGTAYRLSSDKSLVSRTEVIEGHVGVAAGGVEKAVEGGYGIVAEKDKPLPDPVKLLPAPALSDNQSGDIHRLHVSWPELDGARYYRYQLARDINFNRIVVDSTTQDNTLRFDELVPAAYYLRVRGVDAFKLEGLDSTRKYEVRQKLPEPPPEDDYWKIIISIGLLIILL